MLDYKYVINFLNELVKLDNKAMRDLVETRVLCNKELADHPTVQVSSSDGDNFRVGLLGILNGLCGARESDGWGYIAANFDDDNNLIEFIETPEQKAK